MVSEYQKKLLKSIQARDIETAKEGIKEAAKKASTSTAPGPIGPAPRVTPTGETVIPGTSPLPAPSPVKEPEPEPKPESFPLGREVAEQAKSKVEWVAAREKTIEQIKGHTDPNKVYRVEWRDPYGETKAVLTHDIEKVSRDIMTPGGTVYGEITHIAVAGPTGPGATVADIREQVAKTPTIEERIREEITWGDVEKTLTPEMEYILKHQSESGAKVIKKRYEEAYEESLISGDAEAFAKETSDIFTKGIGRLPESNVLGFTEQFGKFNGKTWKEYEVAHPGSVLVYDVKTKEVGIGFDPLKWQKVEHTRAVREGDWGFLIGETAASIFSPERYEYAYKAAFKSPTWAVGTQRWKKYETGQERLLASGHYEYHTAWRKGDWLKIGTRFITSPLVFPFATQAAFKGASLVARGVVPAVKAGVRAVPKVYGKVQQTFPSSPLAPGMIAESGKFVTTRTTSFVSKIGRTRWWQNIYGWSTGELTRVRYLPMVRTIETDLGKGFKGRVEIYKGWGKVKWEPTRLVSQRMSSIGEAGVRYIETPFGAESSSIFQQVNEPRGMLWWKKGVRQVIRYEEIERVLFEPVDTGPVVFKAPGFVRDITTKGITVKGLKAESGKTAWSKFVGIQRMTEFGTGEPFQKLQRFWYSPEKEWHLKVLGKKITSSFFRSEEASVSLIRPITSYRSMVHHGMKHTGYLAGRELMLPAVSHLPNLGTVVPSFITTGVITSTALAVTQLTDAELDYVQMYKPDWVSARRYVIDTEIAQATGQASLMDILQGQRLQHAQMQKQAQATKLATMYETPTRLVTTYAKPSVPPAPIIHIPYPSRPPFLLFPEGKRKIPKIKYIPGLGTGYRFRRWKVPTMEELLRR